MRVCEFYPNDKWSLLYRGTRDGFGSSDFHSKCDGHPNTLTLLKAKQSAFIFGGFTSVKWESCGHARKWKADSSAFLFSLTNRENTPCKIKIDPSQSHKAIYCNTECGPSFGGGCDIRVGDKANEAMGKQCFSRLGRTYKHSNYAYGTSEAKTFLAGSHEFKLEEIEVYRKE